MRSVGVDIMRLDIHRYTARGPEQPLALPPDHEDLLSTLPVMRTVMGILRRVIPDSGRGLCNDEIESPARNAGRKILCIPADNAVHKWMDLRRYIRGKAYVGSL